MAESITEKAAEIAYAAFEIKTPHEREAFLKSACAGDPQLGAAVAQMLASQPGAERFFQENSPPRNLARELTESLAGEPGFRENAAPVLSADDALGKQIGPYKILQKIGEGGCGVVYMAEQEKPIRRRVALKIIKLGMDTKNVIARFEAERQALAMMDHPHIARVLDAGATETGRPYFVMELVHGIRITEYCDKNKLDTNRRLELFIQVCHAIQHAHQKGIVHRDIKPSNILITLHDGVPVPKVIDFGIAKAMEEKLTDKTLFTVYGNFIGTPAYMSPEQAEMSGLDIDTRSDIYSLGVLLYELLTGKTPFEQKELLASGLDQMRKTLREREPHRPSTRLDTMQTDELTLTALRRHLEPPKLQLLLKGDLDWIVMKALEKDRRRRYETANGLAMDVRRFLDNEPVLARSPGRWYRFQKLVRRNRAVFVTGGTVALALVISLGTATWMFFKEREMRHRAVSAEQAAEQARKRETVLRVEAEARAKISRAAVLLSQGKPDEADQLVDKIHIPVIQPSLEAASVFRNLGDWNVEQGRWRPAADRYLNLIQANQVDKTDMTDAATRDLLLVPPALIEAGRIADYQTFVKETISRFSATKNPVAAEQVLKVSSILPTDAADIKALVPLAAVAEKSFAGSGLKSNADQHMFAWRALALSLFEYRRGDFANAISWGRKSLGYSGSRPTQIAMCHLVLALTFSHLHQRDAARSELAQGRKLVENRFPNGMEKITDFGSDYSGLWYDWVMAQILLNEATNAIHAASLQNN
jgi:serine/threonine protein kinase